MIRDDWKMRWRMSATSSLINRQFFAWGLPPPDNILYKTYSERVPQSEGATTLQGYKNVKIFWNRLFPEQAFTLRKIVQDAIDNNNRQLYLTIDRQNAQGMEDDWIDIHGVVSMPTFDTQPGARGRVFSAVTLAVTNVIVDNDPAVF